jgi:signal transduction histidine kinase
VRFATVIAVETDIDPGAAAELDDDASNQVLGLAREALSNASRHSSATTVRIGLVRADAWVCLAVEDDGVGFDPMRTFGPDHQGLTNMRERAELLGGTLLIERQPGGGTRVIATIPVAGGHGA